MSCEERGVQDGLVGEMERGARERVGKLLACLSQLSNFLPERLDVGPQTLDALVG